MKHRATPDFWALYRSLPLEVRQLADKSYDLLKQNSQHPSLRFKKVGHYWSARVGSRYRAVAVATATEYVWFWIGNHSDYDKLLR